MFNVVFLVYLDNLFVFYEGVVSFSFVSSVE